MRILSFLLSFICFSTVSSQWKPLNGPESGRAYSFCPDGTVIYAGTNNGVFKSVDSGRTWIWKGLNEVLVVRKFNQALYACSMNGVFSSEDNGETWTDIRFDLPNAYTYDIHVWDSRVFLGTPFGVFLLSPAGNAWVRMKGSPNHVRAFASIGRILLLSSNSVLRYDDIADTWVNWSTPAVSPWKIHVFGDELYGVHYGTYGLLVSRDSGKTWTDISKNLQNRSVQSVIVRGTEIHAGTYGGGVYFSTDTGKTWHSRNAGLGNGDVEWLTDFEGKVFAGTYGGGVYVSNYGDTTWIQANRGLVSLTASVLVEDDGNLFAGTAENGLFMSTDKGKTWNAANQGMKGFGIRTMDASGNLIFANSDSGMYLSHTMGKSWERLDKGPKNTDRHLAITRSAVYCGQGGALSVFDPVTKDWKVILDGIGVNALKANGDIIIAGTVDKGLYMSFDNGAKWNNIQPFPKYTKIEEIAIDGHMVYILSTSGVWVSPDSGKSWSRTGPKLEHDPYYRPVFAVSGKYILAGTAGYGQGVYRLTDSIWVPINAGLQSRDIHSLLITGNTVYAGSGAGGVWQAPLEGLTTGISRTGKMVVSGRIFPNPSLGTFAILNPEDVESVKVYDYSGRLLFWQSSAEGGDFSRIDLSHLNKGIYTVIVQEGPTTFADKLILR